MQQAYLDTLKPKISADSRIRAAWLEGSFGRGNADRHSDLDIHLLLAPEHWQTFQAEVKTWLSPIRPLVLFNLLFDGKMVNALTADGLRLDVWLHAGETMAVNPTKVQVLVQQENSLTFDKVEPPKDPAGVAQTLERLIKEFWRCISLTPAVMGRKELIMGFVGLGIETNLLTEILINGYGVERDSGVKNLNRFLPGETRQTIEQALSLQGLSQTTLVQAHLALAEIVKTQGRIIAERHHFPYPVELEAAVLAYVDEELARLDLAI